MLSTSGTNRIAPMNFALLLRFNRNPSAFVYVFDALVEQRVVTQRTQRHDVVFFNIRGQFFDGSYQLWHPSVFRRNDDAQQVIPF